MVRLLVALLVALAVCAGPAFALDVVDATGRTVSVPDKVLRVLPAGPPAAVLLAALAPDLMVGWPRRLSVEAAEHLPAPVAHLPELPVLTGPRDVTAEIAALHPDLIVDYGSVEPRYREIAENTERQTGIPTLLLDGRLAYTPLVLRVLGRALHREARGEELAHIAEGILASVRPGTTRIRAVYVRGADGAQAIVPGGINSETLEFLGWKLLAPPPQPGESPHASFRAVSPDDIAALDPDILLFGDPGMRTRVAQSEAWQKVRALREGHAWIAPAAPFGWIEEPPSLNRLLGLAWLADGAPHPGIVPLAAVFDAAVYGRTPTPAQIESLRASLLPIAP
jgi:iron complex transport system substrate-binding protein